MSSEEEIYRSSYEELRKTMDNLRKAYARMNQLAVDLAKIDLLTVSAVLAGVSLSGLTLSLPLVAGLVSFGYAMWCCVRIYEPRSFARGIGADAAVQIDEAVRKGRDVEEHYRELMFSYRKAILHLTATHSSMRAVFRNGLWASLTAIVFFIFVVIRTLLPSYPPTLDAIVLVVVPAVTHWGKDKYEQD